MAIGVNLDLARLMPDRSAITIVRALCCHHSQHVRVQDQLSLQPRQMRGVLDERLWRLLNR